ncbi:MAG TPA: acetyltransferase [Burkholderiales bacterium]|nr:acetyltransferase [Burkholderiales bacterium]
MRYIDVFNGDADGICALHQLRLAEPLDTELVTGVKRDIDLLRRVRADAGDRVTVLDVSLERNRPALMALLDRGVGVRYFDHHTAGDLPSHPGFEPHIDESAGVCTSILVDRYLQGRFRVWAVVAAFGDGMPEAALRLASDLSLAAQPLAALRALGENLNYNAYGENETDLLVPPAALYRSVSRFQDPLRLIEAEPLLRRLDDERRADLARALALAPHRASEHADAYVLPNAPWARRVGGTFANRLAADAPARAHAVVAPNTRGGYTVSVRAPSGGAFSAARFCRSFGGGGRRESGGIDHLEPTRLDALLDALASMPNAV